MRQVGTRLADVNPHVRQAVSDLAGEMRADQLVPALIDGLAEDVRRRRPACFAARTFMQTWRGLAAAPPPELDPWLHERLERLAEPTDLVELVSGDALLHTDLRSDNILLTPDGGVVFVDWAWTSNGAPWLDVVLFATTVNAEGGADAERFVRDHPLTRDVPSGWIDAVLLAEVATYWWQSQRPGPETLPGTRAGQRAYAEATLRWTRRRIADHGPGPVTTPPAAP
jgi:hypothetical protein